jgi:hypothetical protein
LKHTSGTDLKESADISYSKHTERTVYPFFKKNITLSLYKRSYIFRESIYLSLFIYIKEKKSSKREELYDSSLLSPSLDEKTEKKQLFIKTFYSK